MPRVTCAFCGLPFHVRTVREGAAYYCCSGCALASRIPVHEGVLPVSRALIIALALGFGLFNQVLFAALGLAVAAEGRAEVGGRLLMVSWSLAGVLFVASITFMATARLRGWTDAAAGLLAAGFGALGATEMVSDSPSPAAATGWLVAANVLLALWLTRGWLRRAVARPGRP